MRVMKSEINKVGIVTGNIGINQQKQETIKKELEPEPLPEKKVEKDEKKPKPEKVEKKDEKELTKTEKEKKENNDNKQPKKEEKNDTKEEK